MQLIEMGLLNPESAFTFDAPFCISFYPQYKIVDPALQALFPVLTNNLNRIYVAGFKRGPFRFYSVVDTYADYLTTEKSFYWDNENQIGYVHLEHEYYLDGDFYAYETQQLYNDLDIIYIDGQESLPLLKSAPEINKQQDLINYDQMAFNSGNAVLDNIDGAFDDFKDNEIYGNTVYNSYIDPDDILTDETGTKYAARSDIKRLSPYYIDDYDFSITEFVLVLKDPREADNKLICTDLFTETDYPYISDEYKNNPIPVFFGIIRECKAYPTNSEYAYFFNPEYRIGLSVTDFGTIQVNINGYWTNATPIWTNEATGEFCLANSTAINADGGLYECRCINPEGIAITTAADIIVWLNEYYTYVDYNDSFYDTAEWEEEGAELSEIGILFNEQILLHEAILKIQNGCNVGFRYDFNNENKRTIRIDDESRETQCVIDNINIANRFDLPIKSDREQVYSYIDIKYNKSFIEDTVFDLESNADNEAYQQVTQQAKTLTLETYLTNQADAITRAEYESLRNRYIPRIVKLEISTPTKGDRLEYLNLRIFDIIWTALTYSDDVDFDQETIEGREYFGFQGLKIISVKPNQTNNNITFEGKIISGYEPNYIFDFDSFDDDDPEFDFDDFSDDTPEYDFDGGW